MPSTQSFSEYALVGGKFVEWNQFLIEHEWAKSHEFTAPVPENCKTVYYIVKENKIIDRATVITFDARYKQDFKELNLAWVTQLFEVEESDIKQLESPEESILHAGVVADVIHDGECELAKMTVRKECTGKGYANILMKESIEWAKEQGFPFIKLYSSVQLENAIALYKKFGFETIHLGKHPSYKRCSIIMQLDFSTIKA
ncbi:hypothetical protein BD770DRAFT_386266 [Pilaira anomala]|nr:hypothetical protein BD770DRAFT_386266 [Pilaira anomala]